MSYAPSTPAPRVVVTLVVAVLGLVAYVGPGADARPAPSSATDPVGVWPLRPEPDVVGDFDPPSSPYSAGHRGVDLAAIVGQRVRAALPGRITYAAPLAGRGIVVVSHGVTRTTYQPVSATVAVGEVVAAGDAVGRLELAGSHCFPRACLHWGWIDGETYLDPLRLVGAGPVRLLPLWRDRPEGPTGVAGPRSPPATGSWRSLLHGWGAFAAP